MSVIDVARSQLGARYVWGGKSPAAGGFDCSGFVSWCYGQVGVSLPSFTDSVAAQTETIPAGSERSGDLVLYRYTDASQPGVTYPHMGLVEAAGQSIDCAYPAGVTEHAMFSYPREFRRVSAGTDAAASPSAAPAGGLAALVPPNLASLAASPWARIAAIAGVAYLALGAINPSSSPWGGFRRNPERHWLTMTTRHRRGHDTQEPAYYQREGDHWRLYYGKTGRTRSVAPTSDRAVSWQVDLAKAEGRYLRHERDNPSACPVCGGPTVASNPRKSKSCDPSKRFCAFWMGPPGRRRLVPFRGSVGYSTEVEKIQKDLQREREREAHYAGLERGAQAESGIERPPFAWGRRMPLRDLARIARDAGVSPYEYGWWDSANLIPGGHEMQSRQGIGVRVRRKRSGEYQSAVLESGGRQHQRRETRRAARSRAELARAGAPRTRGYRPPEALPF